MCRHKCETQGVTNHLLSCPTTILRYSLFSDLVENRRRPAATPRFPACLIARRAQNDVVAHRWSASLAGGARQLDQLNYVPRM
jgi:hypothetical protein